MKSMNSHVKRRLKRKLLRSSPFCHYCGKALTYETATFDHRYPQSLGGTSHKRNLVLACSDCNQEKADKINWMARPEPAPVVTLLGEFLAEAQVTP